MLGPGYFERASVLLDSRLLWVRLLSCAVCFSTCLFGTAFCFVRVPASLCPSPRLSVCFCALLSRLLWDSLFWVLAYPGHFPSFLEMHGLGDFDATLHSVVLISLIDYILIALTVAASRLHWESFCFVRVPAPLGRSPLISCFFALM